MKFVVKTAGVADRISVGISPPQSRRVRVAIGARCPCPSRRRQSSFGFDKRPILSVHFVIKSAGVAEVMSRSVSTPQRRRSSAAIHALATLCSGSSFAPRSGRQSCRRCFEHGRVKPGKGAGSEISVRRRGGAGISAGEVGSGVRRRGISGGVTVMRQTGCHGRGIAIVHIRGKAGCAHCRRGRGCVKEICRRCCCSCCSCCSDGGGGIGCCSAAAVKRIRGGGGVGRQRRRCG